MKRRPAFIPGLVLMIPMLLLAGCSTKRAALMVQDDPMKLMKEEDISIVLRFLDEDTLIDHFGKRANPFLTEYYRMHFKRLVVFELKAQNQREKAIEFYLNLLELHFAGKTLEPSNRFQLGNYWEFRDEGNEKLRPQDRRERQRLIKAWVLPNEATLPPGGKLDGYIVFKGNLPRYGQAMVYIPFFRGEEQEIHRFEAGFEF